MEAIINALVGYIWSDALVYLALESVLILLSLLVVSTFATLKKWSSFCLINKRQTKVSAPSKLSVWRYLVESVSVISQALQLRLQQVGLEQYFG